MLDAKSKDHACVMHLCYMKKIIVCQETQTFTHFILFPSTGRFTAMCSY
jgi:hypothetical protein